ncbi:substrate-binding and VWA domain-containing protein [Sphaerisporangium sp. TRM90804]|uniref:substrate-binding and VWA domain-containing protein n=1 Tax=Sphaerisporangium sp. TRM90804 TaxID=3031113 RepID=UPI0024480888|nr:substrate-binding and VWA domain-containing protein [Sphaerisporangium sp. TRM90804]MDH2429078.1 substrate-binding and VWA domain-containing protein [Sphaerisporangium sp. TRM90804]
MPLAGAVALAVLLGVAAYVIMSRDQGCGENKVALRVVASPDIAPAITKIAAAFNKEATPVDGSCAAVAVKESDPAGVTNSIAGSGATAGRFDADLWIPDSSLWVAKLRSTPKGSGISAPVGSIARSPVVLAAPKPVVEKLQSAFGEPSWSGVMSAANAATPDGLGRRIRVLPLDPTQNAAGLSALLAGAGVLRAGGGGDEQLVGVLRQLSESAVNSPANMFATMGKQSSRAPIGIASEQAIWAFNTRNNAGQIVGLYPAEGTISLDYPVLITAKDQATRNAAKAFSTALTGADAKRIIREQGFRTPDGKGGAGLSKANGLNPAMPRVINIPEASAVTELSQAWSRLKLGGRILALLDISGTMALPAVGASGDRMRLISQTAIEGLKLFPDKTEIGTWIFSTNMNGKGVDYRPIIPVGPIGGELEGTTRREVLIRSLQQIRAKKTGDTGLNDTLAAAYDKMQAEYEADKINTIILFTDGVGNDDPDGGISNQEILSKMRTEFDETQPISVIIIALGADDASGRRQMQALAKATQGEAFFPNNALEIRKVFLEGISRRLCAPNCNAAAQ